MQPEFCDEEIIPPLPPLIQVKTSGQIHTQRQTNDRERAASLPFPLCQIMGSIGFLKGTMSKLGLAWRAAQYYYIITLESRCKLVVGGDVLI